MGKSLSQVSSINKKEYKNIFHSHYNALCAFAYGFLQDVKATEDVVQDAFLSLWEKRTEFENLAASKSFLYTTVRNKSLNILKHQKVVEKHTPHLIQELESEDILSKYILEEETFNRMFQEIKKLPASAREIMLLALNGLKNPEISEELNISVNTVKTQKKIAYAKLKSSLKPLELRLLFFF